MSLAYTPDIFNELRDVNLLLDTSTIIDSSNLMSYHLVIRLGMFKGSLCAS